ncbi:uncharacterized protein LOC135839784 [Planococcus citri]|uniref:uncharacterized protein LOC135839784 n=1 Tax=Planococcus citri TaxID=170843 RepID=UPI0031FA0CD6
MHQQISQKMIFLFLFLFTIAKNIDILSAKPMIKPAMLTSEKQMTGIPITSHMPADHENRTDTLSKKPTNETAKMTSENQTTEMPITYKGQNVTQLEVKVSAYQFNFMNSTFNLHVHYHNYTEGCADKNQTTNSTSYITGHPGFSNTTTSTFNLPEAYNVTSVDDFVSRIPDASEQTIKLLKLMYGAIVEAVKTQIK